jgi:subtilisin family serine protease
MRGRIVGLLLTASTVVALAVTSAGPAAAEGSILGAESAGAIGDSYIVVLKDSASPRSRSARTAGELTGRYGGGVRTSWQHALNGFAATMNARQARRLAANPQVAYVQADITVRIADTQFSPPSWGLDRVDQRDLPLSGTYSYGTTASTVHAYVIDTGIRTTHSTFGGRASWGFNAVDGDNTDCNGHGTHVAGTIGGAQYGVAKGVSLVAVKVLNCNGSGTASGTISGIDWVTANAIRPAVANMSLGFPGPSSVPAVDSAVRASIQSGITYAVAAGNDNGGNACLGTPSKVAEAITVGSTDINDSRSSFSNAGACVDLFAPGRDITSSWFTSDTATNLLMGTSMATPHVTGAAALYLSVNPAATPATVQSTLIGQSTGCKVRSAGTGSPNRLLFTAAVGVTVLNPCGQNYTEFSQVSLQLHAVGGTAPYTWSMSGICCRISINPATGLISGIAQAGTFTVTVTATAAAGGSATTTFGVLIPRECRTC